MATTDITSALLDELATIDDREDRILDVLLRQGAELEEARRRSMMVTVGDLRALGDGLASLEAAIDDVRARAARAEAAAKDPGTAGPANDTPAPATPAAPGPDKGLTSAAPEPATTLAPTPSAAPAPTIQELGAKLREHDAEVDRMRALLRERLRALGAIGPDPAGAAPAPGSTPTPTAAPNTIASAPAPATPSPLPTPTPAAGPTFRPSAKPAVRSDVRAFQRDLNRRFELWGIGIRVREDGLYGKTTHHAAKQVLIGLGIAPADYAGGVTPQLRALVHSPSARSDAQKARAAALKPWLARLRQRESHKPTRTHGKSSNGKPSASAAAKPSPKPGPTAPPAGSIAARINAQRGHYGTIIEREAKRYGLDPVLVCAVVDVESGFRNVFGSDPVKGNQIKSPAHPKIPVTRERYQLYLQRRKAKLGMQGVGPMQLTYFTLQDEADGLGGCWRESANIRIGCKHLRNEIDRLHSKDRGIRAYNDGTGTKQESIAYLDKVRKAEVVWRRHLAGAKASPPATAKPGTTARPGAKPKPAAHTPGKPRTFTLPMRGEDVRGMQREINATFERWNIKIRISEDGVYAKTTKHAAKQVLIGLGIDPAAYAHGITPQLRIKIRDPRRRTPQEKARYESKVRTDYRARLRKQSASKSALRLRAYDEAKRLENLDVREVGANNRGRMVEEIIRTGGGSAGQPWCGWFIAHCYKHAGAKTVTPSWGRVFSYTGVPGIKKTSDPLKGDLVRYLDGQGHIGMFVAWCDSAGRERPKAQATHIKTIEGNTSSSGAIVSDSARGGDGVYEKVRRLGFNGDYLRVTR